MEQSVNIQSATIGEIARYKSNTIQVFRKYGIDFFCKGNHLLAEACSSVGCDAAEVAQELQFVLSGNAGINPDFNDWSLNKLITHIVDYHHKYVNVSVPEISDLFKSILGTPDSNGFELKRINDLFRQLGNDMKQHMQKEELALFPFIKKLESGEITSENVPKGLSVKSMIAVVEFEHDTSGIIISQINRLCNNYKLPENASHVFGSLFAKLSEFEADLIMHIHLENNVLHKKAIELEQSQLN
jgi:regulator of cell morphogenesis and NO signaling